MKTNTKNQIFDFIRDNVAVGPSRLAEKMGISPQMVHRHLKLLLQQGLIQKLGSPPKVLYQVADAPPPVTYEVLPKVLVTYINEHYLTVKPSGKVLKGEPGFQWWAHKTGQQKLYGRLAAEYVTEHKKIDSRFGRQWV